VRRNGPTEPDRLVWPTRPGSALQPPHAAGARYCAPGAAWTVPESRPAAQGRPASSRQAGHGTTGRRSSGRTRGHGWRIAGRGLVTGGFLLCGWLVTSAGHAAAAETATPAAPHHDFSVAASRNAGAGAGNQIVPGLDGLTRPAAAAATVSGRPARTVSSATSSVTSHPGAAVTSAATPAQPAAARPAPVKAAAPSAAVRSALVATPLAARPADPAGPPGSDSSLTSGLAAKLIGALRAGGASLATRLLQSLGGPASHGVVPGSLRLPSLPSLASQPVASMPGATDVATIVPVGVNPGGPNRPAGNLPGRHPLMRMARRQASGPARTARPAVTALTLAPVPAAAAQRAASWTGLTPQQYAGARLPGAPHRSVPGGDKLGAGAATQTDPVPAGGAGATQMAAPLPSRSGQPNLAGWLIRMRMSRSPAGLQRADDPAVSPD
jgi:hypothetical protein